jgi:hypothetical protein
MTTQPLDRAPGLFASFAPFVIGAVIATAAAGGIAAAGVPHAPKPCASGTTRLICDVPPLVISPRTARGGCRLDGQLAIVTRHNPRHDFAVKCSLDNNGHLKWGTALGATDPSNIIKADAETCASFRRGHVTVASGADPTLRLDATQLLSSRNLTQTRAAVTHLAYDCNPDA